MSGEDGGATSGARWLLLIHQLPTEPAYLRVKVSRRLKRLGAFQLKSSVYVLPWSEESREDFAWLRREITDGGGDATVVGARVLEGLSDAQLRERFSSERDEEYGALSAELQGLLESDAATESDLRRLRTRLEGVVERDFFGAAGRFSAAEAMRQLEQRVQGIPRGEEPVTHARPSGAIWVTREGARIDRLASAWLIRRFIDPDATFRFVPADGYRAGDGELRFDMYDGEFTHEGDRCTFETLVQRFGLSEPGLSDIGEIVHDLDVKDEKFGRAEAAGVASLIAGIVSAHARDEDRLEAARPVFDALLAGFGRTAGRV